MAIGFFGGWRSEVEFGALWLGWRLGVLEGEGEG